MLDYLPELYTELLNENFVAAPVIDSLDAYGELKYKFLTDFFDKNAELILSDNTAKSNFLSIINYYYMKEILPMTEKDGSSKIYNFADNIINRMVAA
jgi:hypothetical protein